MCMLVYLHAVFFETSFPPPHDVGRGCFVLGQSIGTWTLRVLKTLRVHVTNTLVLGFGVIIIIQVLGKYMIIRYLDP